MLFELRMAPRFRRQREALEELEAESGILKSEILELDADGKPCKACTASKQSLDLLGNALNQAGSAPRVNCPPDVNQIGNAGWTLLHTIAAYYPDNPSPKKKESIVSFYNSFAQVYPCSYCADELRLDLEKFKIKNSNRIELSIWTCQLHNRVNQRLGKIIQPCTIDYLGYY